MSELAKQMGVIQGYGSEVNSAVRESKKAIEDNQFVLGAEGGKYAKFGLWAVAAVGVAVGLATVAAAPVLGVAAVGVGLAAGVSGSALGRVASEREQLRTAHERFVSQARTFMKDLQVAYTETKHAMQVEQRQGASYSADYVQYQAQRESQEQAQKAEAALRLEGSVAPSMEGPKRSGPSFG